MARIYPEVIPAYFTEHRDLEDAYRRGWSHGHGIACHNVPTIGDRLSPCVDHYGYGVIDADNIRDVHEMLCHDAADTSRCYSPFEFTAHEFNEAGEGDDENPSSDRLWEAFEQGTADAICADVAEYTDEDYGIEHEDTDED